MTQERDLVPEALNNASGAPSSQKPRRYRKAVPNQCFVSNNDPAFAGHAHQTNTVLQWRSAQKQDHIPRRIRTSGTLNQHAEEVPPPAPTRSLFQSNSSAMPRHPGFPIGSQRLDQASQQEKHRTGLPLAPLVSPQYSAGRTSSTHSTFSGRDVPARAPLLSPTYSTGYKSVDEEGSLAEHPD